MAERPWADMTPEERRAWRIERWRNPDIEFKSPEAEADYKARVDRILAAINLREARPGAGEPHRRLLAGSVLGGTDSIRCDVRPGPRCPGLDGLQPGVQARHQVSPSVQTTSPARCSSPSTTELYSWPGHGVAEDASYQYNEKEWMLPEEYDHLISDPSDYMLRTYLPRTVGAFAGFASLSSLFDFIEMPFVVRPHGRLGLARDDRGTGEAGRRVTRGRRLGSEHLRHGR